MFVLRKTMEAALEAQRQDSTTALAKLTSTYGDALNRVTALQQTMSAWLLNEPRNITARQMAQMFYAQDDRWQADFFNLMQEEVRAHHAALPAPLAGEFRASAGVPAGEGQWWHMAGHLTDEGFETLQAMFEHARDRRSAPPATQP